MPVKLSYEASSEGQGGRNRLRRLASFGRYGADVCESSEVRYSQVLTPEQSRKNCSLLASSLSSFYSWLSKQAGHKVNFGSTSTERKGRVSAKQQVCMTV